MTEKCESCSKEKINKVPIRRVIEKLDGFFAKNDLKGAGELLEFWENEGRRLNDTVGTLEILNEEIGFYRRIQDEEKGLSAVNEAIKIIDEGRFVGTPPIGVIYINCATTLKAFGLPEKAVELYTAAENIFDDNGYDDKFKRASLYNNASSAYADLKNYGKAENYCKKAIDILSETDEYPGERAVSYINLAQIYFDVNPFDENVNKCLEAAWELLTGSNTVKDGNYAFICSKCGPSFGFFGQFEREEYLKNEAEKIYDRS